MKRYIVTDEELRTMLISAMKVAGASISFTEGPKLDLSGLDLKPVPEWATHFAGDPYSGYDTEFKRAENIPK